MLMILISSNGLSSLFVLTFSIACTTSSPDNTRPNIVCFLSNHGVALVVMKNCEPFVLGHAFAMLTVYGLRARTGQLFPVQITTQLRLELTCHA